MDWQVSRFLTFENSSGVDADLPINIRNTPSVAHQATSRDKVAKLSAVGADWPSAGADLTNSRYQANEKLIKANSVAPATC